MNGFLTLQMDMILKKPTPDGLEHVRAILETTKQRVASKRDPLHTQQSMAATIRKYEKMLEACNTIPTDVGHLAVKTGRLVVEDFPCLPLSEDIKNKRIESKEAWFAARGSQPIDTTSMKRIEARVGSAETIARWESEYQKVAAAKVSIPFVLTPQYGANKQTETQLSTPAAIEKKKRTKVASLSVARNEFHLETHVHKVVGKGMGKSNKLSTRLQEFDPVTIYLVDSAKSLSDFMTTAGQMQRNWDSYAIQKVDSRKLFAAEQKESMDATTVLVPSKIIEDLHLTTQGAMSRHLHVHFNQLVVLEQCYVTRLGHVKFNGATFIQDCIESGQVLVRNLPSFKTQLEREIATFIERLPTIVATS